jgi:hypothetical protein
MIHNKIIPSFYLIELNGAACHSFMAEEFKIEKIVISSLDFKTDIMASGAADELIEHAINHREWSEQVDLNPEFFPMAPAIELTQAEKEAIELEKPDTSAALFDKAAANEVADHFAKITTHFDELGDFVQSRTIVTGNDYKIVSKIIANPTMYANEKALQSALEIVAMTTAHRDVKQTKYIH